MSGAQTHGRGPTVIKVCGLTRLEDAQVAHDAGADWLGFILLGESPRRIEAARARAIVDALDSALAVAVLVAPGPDQALELATACGARPGGRTTSRCRRRSACRWTTPARSADRCRPSRTW